MMKVFTFEKEQFVATNISETWEFFSLPDNLKIITPPYLNFKILQPKGRKAIHTGMRIAYKVHPILGIPMKWVTKIEDVMAPHAFVDTQEKGPYKLWKHTHSFIEKENGVLIKDKIEYALPFGFLGVFAHSLFVKKQLEGIFEFRKKVINDIFN